MRIQRKKILQCLDVEETKLPDAHAIGHLRTKLGIFFDKLRTVRT